MFRQHFSLRRLTMFFLVLSLLFSQLALASYVCPKASTSVAMAEMMAMGEPCAGMDTAQPVLWYQYATGMSQSSEQVKVVTPSLPAIVQVLHIPLVLMSQSDALSQRAEPEWQHSPPYPVFLATGRLRV
jgi:hypothetical protein